MNYFLEGKSVGLRAFSKQDLPVWYTWFNDPDITEYMNKGIFPNSIEEQENFYKTLAQSQTDIQFAIVTKANNTLVGAVGIHQIAWIHRYADISIVIGDKSAWGKGLATEAIGLVVNHAFLKTNLRRLTAGTLVKNTATIKCFEKNGFIREGTQRKHLFSNGEYEDIVLFGLLRNEWKN